MLPALDTWTDQNGTVHLHRDGVTWTLCDVDIWQQPTAYPKIGCDDCSREYLRIYYSENHTCGEDCRAWRTGRTDQGWTAQEDEGLERALAALDGPDSHRGRVVRLSA